MTQAESDLILKLFIRYQHKIADNMEKLQDLPNKCDGMSLYTLCTLGMTNLEDCPFDKLCRWLGFIQGVLAIQGIIDVDEERDYTRPLFHALYGKQIKTFDTNKL